ncbi:MAG: serine/threonine protein kinase [Mariniblastus sp.]|nr:serine/threonine protein kinase [Mariniblastus sp.]
MLNDRKASELVTKSMRRALTDEETGLLAQNLTDSKELEAFAKISHKIQISAVEIASLVEQGDRTLGPGLSDEAKDRLRGLIQAAQSGEIDLPELEPGQTQAQENSLKRTTQLPAAGGPFWSRRMVAEQPGAYQGEGDARVGESRYTLIRPLGKGGLGNVWLARDERLKRNVAIKELNAETLASEVSWQRFRREAEITGLLEHPSIVPLYQYGLDKNTGEPFYAMRFVGKRTLADAIIEHHEKIRAGELDDAHLGLHRLLNIFLDICQAIAYAHSRGVMHRDLKPENVALDNFGQVIVLDWGLAKLSEDGELIHHLSRESNLADKALAQTVDGEVVGTPLYMAPEQASGDLDHIDERTDVYGLGGILFSILTGCAPHESSGEGARTNLKEVLKVIAESRSPEPSDYAENVPRQLESICIKSMAFKSHLRYERVSQLSDAVELWLAGQSEKKSRYEDLRMAGRELRADLQSTIRDLETNARFMSRLPPIQELITAEVEQDVAVWRERLTTIYTGLLTAKSDYQTISYCRIEAGLCTEIVRVERHSTDHSNIRPVPRSRLRQIKTNSFLETVIQQKPEEVLTSLVCDNDSEPEENCFGDEAVHLVAAVPVYDQNTEEPYGVVLIDCDIDRVMRRQVSQHATTCEIVIACDIHQVMMRSHFGHVVEDSISKRVEEETPHFCQAVSALEHHLEFIDETNAEIYGARLWLTTSRHGVMYLLRSERNKNRA